MYFDIHEMSTRRQPFWTNPNFSNTAMPQIATGHGPAGGGKFQVIIWQWKKKAACGILRQRREQVARLLSVQRLASVSVGVHC